MANIFDPTPEQIRDWDLWVSDRPRAVRECIQKYDLKPWVLYRLKGSSRVTILSVNDAEDGTEPTLSVRVSGEFNLVAFERDVFGIAPSELEECDLPADGELVGAALSQEEAKRAIEGKPAGNERLEAIAEAVHEALSKG